MLAAEYAAAPGLRHSLLGDSVEALARALSAQGHQVTVLTPGYGVYAIPQGSTTLPVTFAGEQLAVASWTRSGSRDAVTHVVVDHPLFSPQGPGRVYCNDQVDAPYATDATKFALFAAAAAQWVSTTRLVPDVVHAHDWQAALYFVLRSFDPRHIALKNIHSVFSLHSMTVQGVRPLALHPSSLRSWFPDLAIARRAVVDPRFADCTNPVAAALRLADAVCVPSPQLPNQLQRRKDPLAELLQPHTDRRPIVAIEPGGAPRPRAPKRPAWRSFTERLKAHNLASIGRTTRLRSAHYLAQQRLADLPSAAPRLVVSLCGPFDASHLALLRAPIGKAPSVLDALLGELGGNETLLALGHGDTAGEAFLTEVAARQPRLVYIQEDEPALSRELQGVAHFHLLLPSEATSAAAALPALNAGRLLSCACGWRARAID